MVPFQRAHNFNKPLWDFFEKYPGYLQRIQMAMVAWATLQPQQDNLKGENDFKEIKGDSDELQRL